MKEMLKVSHHEPLILDQSLYELEVEKVRYEGSRRERRGMFAAMKQFLQSPKGKMLGIVLSASSASSLTGIAIEQAARHRADVYSVEDAPPQLDSFMGDRPLAEVRSELTKWLGEDQVRDLIPVQESDRDRSARERRREELRRAEVADVEGFEEAGISNELVIEYLETGFPRFMTARTTVEEVEFTAEHRPVRADYHLASGSEVAGTCTVGEGDDASEISLYGSLLDYHGRLDLHSAFGEVLVHELAHAIDWENLDAVDPATRTRMLHQMVSHVRDESRRLRFPYVEQISTPDEHERLRNRTVEYYAEFASAVLRIGAAYPVEDPSWEAQTAVALIRLYGGSDLADHEDFFMGVRDDVALVREIVRAYDPDFDWQAAGERRHEVLNRMYADRLAAEMRRNTEMIPTSEARSLLQEVFEEGADIAHTEARFIRHAGTVSPDSVDLYQNHLIERDDYRAIRELEREINTARRASLESADANLSPDDLPAYRLLTSLLETVVELRPDADSELLEAVFGMFEDYQRAATHATSAHIEAARRYMDILNGRTDLPEDLHRRITRLLAEIGYQNIS